MKKIIISIVCMLFVITSYSQVKSVDLGIDQSGIDSCYTIVENTFSAEVITLVPNPCTGFLTVTYQHPEKVCDLQITVINMQGKIIYDEKLLQQKEFSTTIDISDQPNGMYILKIVGDNKIYSTEIIKK